MEDFLLSEISVVYSTFKTKEEALLFSKKALSEKLIACANIHKDVTSLYNWENSLCEETECSVIFKLKKCSLPIFLDFIKENHPYSTPCALVFDVKTTPEFFKFCNK